MKSHLPPSNQLNFSAGTCKIFHVMVKVLFMAGELTKTHLLHLRRNLMIVMFMTQLYMLLYGIGSKHYKIRLFNVLLAI